MDLNNDSLNRDSFLEVLGLKEVDRAGWKRSGLTNVESVAGHSWGVAFLALQICPPNLDRLRLLEMAICHDVAEVRIGDITPHDGVPPEEKVRIETEAMLDLAKGFHKVNECLNCIGNMKQENLQKRVFSNSVINWTWHSSRMFTNHELKMISVISESPPIASLLSTDILICLMATIE